MLTVKETSEQVRSGQLSAVAAVRRSLGAISAADSGIGAFLSVCEAHAVRQAEQIDARLAGGDRDMPLAGVPLALKDNMCTAFAPTTCASKILRDFRPPYSAHAVERLESAGAVVVGKCNMDEFAMGSSTENSGLASTRNPWDHDRVPGGSSGGSAVAVAADMVPAALGSDTGGSIRQPASLCGVVGSKPTYGRVSRYGLVAFGSSLDQIGPFARTAEDVALLLGVMAGRDGHNSTSVDRAVPVYTEALNTSISGVRVGVAREYFGEGLDAETRSAVESAVDLLRDAGAQIVDVRLPHMKYGIACYYIIATAEASSNLARYDGVHYGHRTTTADNIVDLYAASREEAFGAEVKRRIMLGTFVLSSGYYDAYYLRAMKVRTLLRRDFEKAFESVDVICSPVSPSTAFRRGEKISDPLAMYLADVYTISANLAGIPAISLPCGHDSAGLPIGMQFMAPAFAEERLLNVAHQYQQLTDHHTRRPA